MIDSFVLLAPLLLIPVVALVCFVGCDVVFGLTPIDPGPAPTNFVGVPGDAKVVLSWDAYPGSTGYRIQRGEVSGVYTTTSSVASDQTSFTDANLSNGITYFYIMHSSTSGQDSYASEEVMVTPNATALVPFVTSFMPGALVTTMSGWFGLEMVVGPSPVTAKTLGRAFAPGNNQIHVIKLVDANGVDVPNAFTSVSMTGGIDGEFKYGPLTPPVVLNPGTTYFIVSQETAATDQFYNHNLTLQTTDAAVVQSSIRGGPPYTADNPGLRSYGPVSFQY